MRMPGSPKPGASRAALYPLRCRAASRACRLGSEWAPTREFHSCRSWERTRRWRYRCWSPPEPSDLSRAARPSALAFDPFPFQRFGFYNATIVSVSATLLKPSEAAGPVTLKEPSYRVTARLERQTVTAYGNEILLGPDVAEGRHRPRPPQPDRMAVRSPAECTGKNLKPYAEVAA